MANWNKILFPQELNETLNYWIEKNHYIPYSSKSLNIHRLKKEKLKLRIIAYFQ